MKKLKNALIINFIACVVSPIQMGICESISQLEDNATNLHYERVLSKSSRRLTSA